MNYKVSLTPYFQKEFKKLKRKFRKIGTDLEKLIDELEQNPFSGTPLGNSCYKIRVPNSSIPTGKSGGFRTISLIKIEKETVILLTIYSKTDKDNISDNEIMEILKEIE